MIATPANPEFAATDPVVVKLMLDIIHPTKSDILFDLGCGDGRIVIEAARTYGCRAVGVEINPLQAAAADINVFRAGVEDRVLIRNHDIMDETLLSSATIVVMYLYPDLIKQIMPLLGNADTIVSISHQMPRVKQTRYICGSTDVFVFRKGK